MLIRLNGWNITENTAENSFSTGRIHEGFSLFSPHINVSILSHIQRIFIYLRISNRIVIYIALIRYCEPVDDAFDSHYKVCDRENSLKLPWKMPLISASIQPDTSHSSGHKYKILHLCKYAAISNYLNGTGSN